MGSVTRQPRYLLLHRALRNAGDYLIRTRATELIRTTRPVADLTFGEAWRPLTGQFSEAELAGFDAIVVCGGPGLQREMHPRVYPLMPLEHLRTPVLLLSMGSYFFPADARTISSTELDTSTVRFLRRLAAVGLPISVRDDLSERLVRRHGFDSVTMTGDVAWYRPGAPDQARPPADIDSVSYTPPANPLFFRDGLDVLHGLRRYLPRAHITVVFHRDPQPPFEAAAREIGAETVSIAGSADGFNIHDGVAVHVGYRLHAHLYRLSGGGASYLVAEDSRGVGALETLGMVGVNPFTTRPNFAQRRLWAFLPRLGNPRRRLTRPIGVAASRWLGVGNSAGSLIGQLDSDARDGFLRHASAYERIKATRARMTGVLEVLPT